VVLEYDGTAWRLLSLPGGTGAFSLAVDSDGRPTLNGEDEIGRIYVGGAGALGILAPDLVGTMRYISLTEKIPEPHRDFVDRVVQILITPERVVFLSDKRLFIYQDDEIRVVVSDDHFFSCAYQGGTLYVIDGVKGLAKVNETGLESIDGGGCGALIRCCPMSRNSCLRCSYTEG